MENAMQVTPEIALRNVARTPAIEAAVQDGIASLEATGLRITSCRVMVEVPHRKRRTGNAYRVRIDLRLPETEIMVNRPPARSGPEEPAAAIEGAFDTVHARLRNETDRRRQTRRPREKRYLTGRVTRLFPADGYGFLEASGGRQVYFHENAVKGKGFGALEIGQEVRFSEEPGDEGPQASAVIP
jgi:cold shock CspA family protein/ribosome-associated translation inhibitor RaiA